MPEDNPNVQAVEVKSICFLCGHCQVMGVQVSKAGVHPLSGKSGTFFEQKFMIVCQANGSFVMGPNVDVLSCTSFDAAPGGMKALKMPKPQEEVPDATVEPTHLN